MTPSGSGGRPAPGDPPAIRAEQLERELEALAARTNISCEHYFFTRNCSRCAARLTVIREVFDFGQAHGRAEREPETPLRAGCNCQCCDHSESTDCACDCHLNGACGIAVVEVAWHRKRLKDVRAEEREDCAKIAELFKLPWPLADRHEQDLQAAITNHMAAAIRDQETR